MHTVAGASSGVVNAAITGGDIGRETLIGGLSAGADEYFGGANGPELPGRMMIGATAGGVSSVMHGGDFAQGAIQGAWTSAAAYLFNECMHEGEAAYAESDPLDSLIVDENNNTLWAYN